MIEVQVPDPGVKSSLITTKKNKIPKPGKSKKAIWSKDIVQ